MIRVIRIEGNKPALYQWDLNMRVILTNVPIGTEVHYSNINDNTDENCITSVSYSENGCVYADIPNKLLQISGIILVYLYIQDEDKAWTELKTEIIVLPRKKPANYVYTETEVLTYKKLEVKLDQTQDMIGNLADLETASKDNLVDAINEANLSDTETLNLLIEEDILPAVCNADGAILTDQNGNIVLRY